MCGFMFDIYSKPFALPTKAATDAWLHEVKYNGYRLLVVRGEKRVRLISKGGHDYARRFPWIVEAALTATGDMIMRTMLVIFALLIAGPAAVAGSASPVSYDYPWCVYGGELGYSGDCSYETREQC